MHSAVRQCVQARRQSHKQGGTGLGTACAPHTHLGEVDQQLEHVGDALAGDG